MIVTPGVPTPCCPSHGATSQTYLCTDGSLGLCKTVTSWGHPPAPPFLQHPRPGWAGGRQPSAAGCGSHGRCITLNSNANRARGVGFWGAVCASAFLATPQLVPLYFPAGREERAGRCGSDSTQGWGLPISVVILEGLEVCMCAGYPPSPPGAQSRYGPASSTGQRRRVRESGRVSRAVAAGGH